MRKIHKMGDSLSLPELIDIDELQAIQDSIAKTVGISSVISSPDGEPLTRFRYPTGFCPLIQSTEEGKRRCFLSFKVMSEKALALKKPTIMYCFAHCALFVAPIIINGEQKGTMFAGQFRPQKFSPEHLKELEETAAEIHLDPQLLTEEAKKMSIFEEDVVRSYSSLLFRIVEAIARQGAQATVLQQAHDVLETRVQKRTAELAMSTEELKQEIRRRKQVEETLRQNEEHYRLFFDSIPDGVVVVNTKGIIVECSRSATLLYKRLREELVGKHITEFLAPASVSTCKKDFSRVQQGETVDGEIQIVRGDGSIIDVWRKGVPLKDADGNIAGVLSYGRDITERKQAEDALRVLDARNRALLENIPDFIRVVDRETTIYYANHVHPTIKREDMIGAKISDFIMPEYRDQHDEIIRQVFQSREPAEFEFLNIFDQFIYARFVPLGDMVMIIGTDITERKRAEDEVKESRGFLAAVIENIPDPIYIKDRQFRFAEVNNAFLHRHNVAKEEIIGTTRFRETDAEIFKTGRKLDIPEQHYTDAEGNQHWTHIKKVPLTDESGEITHVLTISRDITERKQAEERIQNVEQDWRNSFNSLEDVMLIIDRDYNIENINERGLELLGKSKEEVIGQKCYQVISGADSPGEDCPCMKSLETKEVESTDRYEERFGKFFSIKSAPIFDENGEIIKFVDLRRDITERTRAQEQIKASLNEKEILLTEIHHRVKNNMQIITSLLNLQSRYVKDKHDLEIFKDSQNRVRSMALIHENLYQSQDLARIDFADYVQKLASHLFSLYSVSTAVIKLSINIKDVLLDINTAIPCGLIINELVSNSLKYAFPNNREGEIQIKLYASKDDTFSLIVRDNGIGLPEDLDFRDTESLGLQLVTALVEQLKGTIELDRSEGTAFEIVFKKA